MVNRCYVLCLVFLTSVASVAAVLEDDAQSQDAICLATALMSEASIGTYEERVAVAWTIFNRVSSPEFPNSICDVINQRSQYATNQEPTQELLYLAESLIANPGTDLTGGAVYFFSPRSMPKEGDDTGGYDVGGGLYDVTGIDKKVYFPSFTLTHEYAGDIQGVRPTYYMFYQEQRNAEVEKDSEATAAADVVSIGFPVTLNLYVHEGYASGPTISGVQVTGEDGAGHSFEQTTSSDGYVTITGIPGTWSFSASADGYETNKWDQEITETDTKDAYLIESTTPASQGYENSVVGTWRFSWLDCECEPGEAAMGCNCDPWEATFNEDGTISYSADNIWVENWVQYGNTVTWSPGQVDPITDGSTTTYPASFEGTINGNTMSGTSTALIEEIQEYSISYWNAFRVDTRES